MGKENKTFLIGRSAITGRLMRVDQARKHSSTSVVVRMPKAGEGDTGRSKPKKR